VAIWLLAIVPVGVLVLWTRHLDAEGIIVPEQLLQMLAPSLVVSVAIFVVLRSLVRKHGEQEVRSAAERTSRVIGPLALVGLLLFIFGIPLFFLWLSGIWGGH
jgi:Na+/H+ antiporter NhaD/arsenite permease-like protein